MQTTRQEWKTSKGKVLLIGSVLILLLTGCGDKSKEKTPPPPPAVTVAEVAQHKIPIVMEFSGTITSVKTVDIIPRVSGYIEKRYFEEGTFVKEGDPLYLIAVSYTHLTLPTTCNLCRSRWSPYH